MRITKEIILLCLFIVFAIFVTVPLNFVIASNEEGYIKVNGENVDDIFDAVKNNANTNSELVVEIYGTVTLRQSANMINAGKVRFVGKTDDATINLNYNGYGDNHTASGAELTFENLTIDKSQNPNNYNGFYHSAKEIFTNCTIIGEYWVYGTESSFTNCTFIQSSADYYNIWCYGASNLSFTDCTFKMAGKSVLVYNEGATSATINISKCLFIAENYTEKNKAAIEIDDSYTDFNINIYNCQVDCKIISGLYRDKNLNVDRLTLKESENVLHIAEHYIAKEMQACKVDGIKEHWYCEKCQKYFEDKSLTTEVSYESLIIDCGKHEWNSHNAVEPTCSKVGNVKYYTCSRCNQIEVETANGRLTVDNIDETIIPTNGSHTLTAVMAKEATYTTEGNTAYWTCVCDKWFSDSDGKNEITDKTSVIIPKLVEINDGIIYITEEDVANAIKNATSSTVTLPLGKNGKMIISVNIQVTSLNSILNTNKSLAIETSEAIVTFNNTALKNILSKVNGNSSITLEVKKIVENMLNNKQIEAIKNKEINAIISIELLCGDKIISNFGDGKVNIKIPFMPANGTLGSDYVVLYIADDGTIEEIDTTYEDGYLIVNLEHFSEYVIAKVPNSVNDSSTNEPDNDLPANEPDSDSPETGDNIVFYASALLISIVGLVAMYILFKKSK